MFFGKPYKWKKQGIQNLFFSLFSFIFFGKSGQATTKFFESAISFSISSSSDFLGPSCLLLATQMTHHVAGWTRFMKTNNKAQQTRKTLMLTQSILPKVWHSRKSKQRQVATKVPWWNHNFATILKLVRQCIGLMKSQLPTFRTKSIFWAFVVPKLIVLFTTAGWNA